MAAMAWLRALDVRALALDLRALALFRAVLGLASALETLEFWTFRRAWLGAEGICKQGPRRSSAAIGFNLFQAAESDEALALLLVVQLLASLCFAAGLWTGTAGVVCFLFAQSAHRQLRGCMDYGGDALREALHFWAAFFVPVADVWSLDAWLNHRGAPSQDAGKGGPFGALRLEGSAAGRQGRALAPAAALCVPAQLAILYLSTGIWKHGEDWKKGIAVQQVLALHMFRNPNYPGIAGLLFGFPRLCWALTRGTLLLERWGPSLLLLPSELVRLLLVALFCGLHVGMHMCLQTGIFHILSVSAWLSLLPPLALDFIEEFLPQHLRSAARPRGGRVDRVANGVKAVAAAVLLVCLSLANCRALEGYCVAPPRWSRKLMTLAGLQDRWKMFAPDVPKVSYWIYLVGAVQGQGKKSPPSRVLLWMDGAPSFKQELSGNWTSPWPAPSQPRMIFAANRWRKIFEHSNWDRHRVDFGKYMCAQWREAHPSQPLIGVWTLMVRQRVQRMKLVGHENVSRVGIHWCSNSSKRLISELQKPDWFANSPKKKLPRPAAHDLVPFAESLRTSGAAVVGLASLTVLGALAVIRRRLVARARTQ